MSLRPNTEMYFVFKEDGRCDAWEEALFLAGMKRECYKDVRWTDCRNVSTFWLVLQFVRMAY